MAMIGLLIVARYGMLAVMQPIDEDLIGATEARNLLGVSKDTLIRMIARAELTVIHKLPGPNGAYLLSRSEVLRLAGAQAEAAS